MILDCCSLTNASRLLVLSRKLTYNVISILPAFEACGISPLNSRKVLGEPSRNITRPTPPPLWPPSHPPPRPAARLAGLEGRLLVSQTQTLLAPSASREALQKSRSLERGCMLNLILRSSGTNYFAPRSLTSPGRLCKIATCLLELV